MTCVNDIVHAPAGKPPATAFKQRYGADFYGPKIPFGAEVKYHPYSPTDKAKIHTFGEPRLRGIFLGYVQDWGGGWTGELEVLDWEDLDKATCQTQCKIKKIRAGDVEPVLINEVRGAYNFPLKSGQLSQPGLRATELRRQRREQQLLQQKIDKELKEQAARMEALRKEESEKELRSF